ncbi:uncharacterized protein LOC131881963 [Tigriopus californicus]|nr:uncharacterized protein LOC131881963 [Tigriopus californicus]|eukprot:TCALIF_11277-PA protein Name:"Similar to Dat Dopamine N-acetyltransferase (Drosophila melanogaster)" AED:0.03 eAED:0.03 QI:12/1/1/1/1/1/3/65/233
MSKTVNDWEDRIEFRLPKGLEDEDLMLDFVNQHFIPLEPLNVAINLCEPGYRMLWFDNFVRAYIRENLSLMAFDTITNDLVGVAICTECRPESDDKEESNVDEKKDENVRWGQRPRKFGKILELLQELTGSVDLFAKYEVDRYAEFFILCTHSGIRYPGLGTRLSYKIMDVVKAKGFNVMVTEATSYFSQKIFARIGFDTLSEIKYDKYKPEGEVLFPQHNNHEAIKLMVKKL